ncbi:hypothetical protein QYE76_046774 [Lolium multiflorum]|uniref:SLC26A/SulP transporter domain-containing protein n=1 Tax=Lolium multiflorum TaxID=4521 RepID=A0AAD8TNY5_LOLMU|nr:hypothetical protein QYE76_046774 [Lolium multiflorum]
MKTDRVTGIISLTSVPGRTFASLVCFTTGAFSHSDVNHNAGCKTAMSNVIMALSVMVTLLFLMPLFVYTTNGVLGAIVDAVVTGLIDLPPAYHIWSGSIYAGAVRPPEARGWGGARVAPQVARASPETTTRIVPISKDPADETNNDPPSPPAKNGEDNKDEDQEETDEDRWDQRRKKHTDKAKNTPASAPAGGNEGFARKSVPQAATGGYTSPCSPSACRSKDIQTQKTTLHASAFSQYGSNLTEQGDIFPTVANIIKQVLASPPVSSPRRSDLEQLQLSTSLSSLNEETDEGQSYLTPGKALSLGAEDKNEIGWHSPVSGESAASALRSSERRSKSNNDRPSRKLMLETAGSQLFADEVDNSGRELAKTSLHQAPAIKESTPTPHALLEDCPIPALGATVARAPRTKATISEALRKSARSAGVADEPVMARAIRLASDKNAPSSPTPGNFDSPKFTAFQSVPIDKLLAVAHDSCVIFPSSSLGPPEKIISLIQARELAQADLAAARHNAEVEAAKARSSAAVDKDSLVPQEGIVVQTGEDTPVLDNKDKPAKKRKVTKKQYPVGPRPLTRQARAQGRVSK